MTKMFNIKCVVFDIDDTLYLERDYVNSGFTAVSAWLESEKGICGFRDLAWAEFEKGVRGNIFDIVFEKFGSTVENGIVAECVRVYRHHHPKIAMQPDASSCIAGLKGKVAIAALTDGPLVSQRMKASALGLAHWANPIVFTAELGDGFGKPHTKGFCQIEKVTNCQGAQCVYVADNPDKDFGGPKKLQWQTVRIRRVLGLHALKTTEKDLADFEMADLSNFSESIGAGP